MNNSITKFQGLLKELFQFEASDLDFGIYRILNYKRDRIEKFIQKDLVNKLEEAFAKHKNERLTNINERFEKAKEEIIKNLGKDAFVWWEYDDNWSNEDFKKDKEFIIKELSEWKPYIVYVNGQSVLTPNFGDFQVEIKYIEPEFKRLMER